MTSVLVSSNFQIVIPKAIRESMRIQLGQNMQVFQYQNRIELVPIIPVEHARGFLKGIDTSVTRECDRM